MRGAAPIPDMGHIMMGGLSNIVLVVFVTFLATITEAVADIDATITGIQPVE
jgi:hypothetical protein